MLSELLTTFAGGEKVKGWREERKEGGRREKKEGERERREEKRETGRDNTSCSCMW